jgi:CheY-like chemotaxis protein
MHPPNTNGQPCTHWDPVPGRGRPVPASQIDGQPDPDVIVYLEDNEDDSYLLRHALKSAGLPCRLEVINTPMAARRFLAEYAPEAPRLIVCDLGLAGTCGLDLMDWIRNQSHLTQVPIILVTGALSSRQRDRARQIGVNACVEKSLDARDLTAHIQRFLGAASSSL